MSYFIKFLFIISLVTFFAHQPCKASSLPTTHEDLQNCAFLLSKSEFKINDFLLQPMSKKDAEAVIELATDREGNVAQNTNIPKFMGEMYADFLVKKTAKTSPTSQIGLVVVDQPTHQTIGLIVLTAIETPENIPQINPNGKTIEIGFRVHKDFRGKRVMSQVLPALHEYIFKNFQIDTIYARTAETNSAARKLLENTGYIDTGIKKPLTDMDKIMAFNKTTPLVEYVLLRK